MSSAPSETGRMSLFASERSLNDQVWKGYERIVGFDTMPDAEDSVSCNATYTLQVKAKGYARTKHTRTFMCAVDATESRCVRQTDAAIVAVRVLDWEQDRTCRLLTQMSIRKRHALAPAVCFRRSWS